MPKPMLQVRIHGPLGITPVFLALVDSGADVSVFHTQVADGLGIDLTAGEHATASGVGGLVDVSRCPVTIEVEGHRFAASVLFTDGVDPTQPLLGRADLFAEFRIGFDQRNEKLLIGRYR